MPDDHADKWVGSGRSYICRHSIWKSHAIGQQNSINYDSEWGTKVVGVKNTHGADAGDDNNEGNAAPSTPIS